MPSEERARMAIIRLRSGTLAGTATRHAVPQGVRRRAGRRPGVVRPAGARSLSGPGGLSGDPYEYSRTAPGVGAMDARLRHRRRGPADSRFGCRSGPTVAAARTPALG